MKRAANLTLLFAELPWLDRPAAAAEAGFDGVEVQFPYDLPAQDLRDRLKWAGLPMVLFNAPPPNHAGGAPGWAAVPGLEARFRSDLKRALRFADVLKPERLHLMAGPAEGPEARETFLANLAHAAETGRHFTIEPLNPGDRPGYFLNDYDLALDLLDSLEAPNVGLQFDTWHAARIHGDAAAVWDRVRHRVTHVQIAGTEARGAPDPAVLDLVDRIRADGYKGWIAAEYLPGPDTAATLGWLTRYRSSAPARRISRSASPR